MKNRILIIWLFAIWGSSCRKTYEAPLPDTNWPLFNDSAGQTLPASVRHAMEGVYRIRDGAPIFGEEAILKWSYLAHGKDTSFYLSFFCSTDIAFIISEAKIFGDSILVNGYWRKMLNTQTGIARFTISFAGGTRQLLSPSPVILPDSILLNGQFGTGSSSPSRKMVLSYLRPLYNGTPFEIMAHRGGGRTSDLLPVAENSVGMIEFAGRLGATGVEVDTQLTLDSIPVLYHDNTLNLRLIQKDGLVGSVGDYTYQQLNTFVRLTDGEPIPTLREALDAVVYNTALRFVWLDTKDGEPLQQIRQIQAEYIRKAAAAGRSVEILIGIPSQTEENRFRELPDYENIPSLCELSPGDAQLINSRVWAPRWTLGLQNEAVGQVHAAGRKAFAWTLDVPDYISQFISNGNFDGILSDYSPLVAYYYYDRQ